MCTGIGIKPGDGSIICARTVEFGVDGGCKPDGKELASSTPDNKPGLARASKYAAMSMDVHSTCRGSSGRRRRRSMSEGNTARKTACKMSERA
jgi:penicillin V acylase-like amidase (Ntn superfamily)